MFSEIINFVLISSLVAIQSIAGVGILVVGTPILLFLNITIVETMNYLLPISIITSLLNIIIMKFNNNNFYYDINRLKYFFIICIPFVFIGLIILKYSYDIINYDYIVSSIIILTLVFKKKISLIIKNLSKTLNKIILMNIGIIHGMTNSGGTLLSIFLINLSSLKKEIRSELSLFYFFLALIQFIFLYIVFGSQLNIQQYYFTIIYIIIGVILGNILIKYVKEKQFRGLIFFLALISSISLILKNLLKF